MPTRDGTVHGTSGSDQIDSNYVDSNGDRIDAGSSTADVVMAGAGDDTVHSGAGDDLVHGDEGDDRLFGEAGNDELHGGDGDDELHGGDGDDVIYGGAGNDSLFGGAGNDTLYAESGNNLLDGGDGNDVLFGGTGDDTLEGGSGDDQLFAGNGGFSELYGGEGNDTLHADLGINHLEGNEGDDVFYGGRGDHFMYGGAGNDTFVVNDGHGGYTIFGGEDGDDHDRIDASGMNGGAVVHLTGKEQGTLESGDHTIHFSEIEEINLGAGNDHVVIEVPVNGLITAGDGYDTLVLPEDDGSTITYTNETLNPDGSTSYDGYVAFSDGSRLDFQGFEKIDLVPCFTPGTMIDTSEGQKPVEELIAGDRVLTRDHGFQEIVWTGRRSLPRGAGQIWSHLLPVRIARGALGAGLPARDLVVSPGHRVLLAGARAEVIFGERELLVAAADLVGMPGITQDREAELDYIHVMFERHEIIRSEGAWTESFQPSLPALDAMSRRSRDELLELFPELESQPLQAQYIAARPVLSASDVQLLLV